MTVPLDEDGKTTSALRMARLAEAYARTIYRVRAPGQELQLQVGRENPGLAKLLREAWVQDAALLTAWNPDSQPCSRALNESAQQRLLAELSRAGKPWLPARNEPQPAVAGGEDWTEESVLALDLTLPAARALAARYGQVAFLWIDARATPQLVFTAADA